MSVANRTRPSAPLVLASSSPRRREILGTLGIAFSAYASEVDETRLADSDPWSYVERAARAKCDAVLSALGATAGRPYVLAADTIVTLQGRVLGKPNDDRDASEMLRALSGVEHVVATAIALGRVRESWQDARVVQTRVWFRRLAEEQVAGYVRSGEGRDKAGAYAIQGLGAGLATRVEGSYSNVVGLPAAETIDMLAARGAITRWP